MHWLFIMVTFSFLCSEHNGMPCTDLIIMCNKKYIGVLQMKARSEGAQIQAEKSASPKGRGSECLVHEV